MNLVGLNVVFVSSMLIFTIHHLSAVSSSMKPAAASLLTQRM